MSKIRVADYIAKFIKNKGINDFFLLPGGGAMFLVDALGNYKGLNFIACHHEQSAAIAAESYSRVTQNFGVVLVTTGPGSTNAITPVVGAWIESVPMMVISGQVKKDDRIGDKNIRQGGVQEVDIVSMVKNHTKFAVTVDDPLKIKFYLEKAYFHMMNGRKGPVWIDIPLDIQSYLIDEHELEEYVSENISITNIQNKDIDTIKVLLKESKRPLILSGHGIRLANAESEFKEFIKKLRVPVVTTWNAMDLVEHDNILFVGKPGVVSLRAANLAIQNCDLLICIGSRVDNVITAYSPERFAKNAKKILIDIDENEIINNKIKFDMSIISDAKIFINSIIQSIKKNDIPIYDSWIEKCNFWKDLYSIEYEFDFSKNLNFLSHFQFSNILSRELEGEELIATGSSGLGIEAFYVAFNIKKGQRIFLTSGLGAMGYGLPSAIGACIANKRKPIIAIESDGSFQLNIQELAVLKGLNLPILLFIMDNNGYASIRNTQNNYFNGRYVATGIEGNLYMPNISAICSSYEITNVEVTNEIELVESIKLFKNISKPIVVIVKTLENEILMPKCSVIIDKSTGSMLSMPLEDMSPLLSIKELENNMYFPLEQVSYDARRED